MGQWWWKIIFCGSLCLASKALSALCSGLYFQGYSYCKQPWKIVSSSRAESRYIYYLPLELKQRAGMLTAHYKIPELLKLRVFSTNKTHYVNRCYPALSELKLRTLAQMKADPLATAIALRNKLYFISASSAFHQHKSLCLPLTCIKM